MFDLCVDPLGGLLRGGDPARDDTALFPGCDVVTVQEVLMNTGLSVQ